MLLERAWRREDFRVLIFCLASEQESFQPEFVFPDSIVQQQGTFEDSRKNGIWEQKSLSKYTVLNVVGTGVGFAVDLSGIPAIMQGGNPNYSLEYFTEIKGVIPTYFHSDLSDT